MAHSIACCRGQVHHIRPDKLAHLIEVAGCRSTPAVLGLGLTGSPRRFEAIGRSCSNCSTCSSPETDIRKKMFSRNVFFSGVCSTCGAGGRIKGGVRKSPKSCNKVSNSFLARACVCEGSICGRARGDRARCRQTTKREWRARLIRSRGGAFARPTRSTRVAALAHYLSNCRHQGCRRTSFADPPARDDQIGGNAAVRPTRVIG